MIFLIVLIYLYYIKNIKNQIEYFDDFENSLFKSQPLNTIITNIFQQEYKNKEILTFYVSGVYKHMNLNNLLYIRIKENKYNSIYNLERISKKENILVIIEKDIIYNIDLISNNKVIKQYLNFNNLNNVKNRNKLRVICNSLPVLYTMVTSNETNINNYKDIYKKKIGVYGHQSLCSLYLIYTYFRWDFNIDDIIYYTSKYDLYKDIVNKQIDVFFILTSHKNILLTYLFKNTNFTNFVSMDDIDIDKMKYVIPYIGVKPLQMKTYFSAKNTTVNCFYINRTIMTNKNTNKLLVYKFIKTLYNNYGFFKNYLSQFNDSFQWDMLPIDYMYDIHDGAKQFYIEKEYIKYNDTSHEKIKDNDTYVKELCYVNADVDQNCGWHTSI